MSFNEERRGTMNEAQTMPLEMVISGAEISQSRGTYHPVTLRTNRGDLFCRNYQVPDAKCGVIWLNGASGGWASPAKNIYPRLARALMDRGIASLQLSYRRSNDLNESVLDALAGLAFLQHEGIARIALVGHSFGGAVAIQAATTSKNVRTVVTLATQSYGTAPVGLLQPECAMLLIHGGLDRMLPPSCSEYVFERAHDPKKYICFDAAGHSLDEVTGQIHPIIRDWLAAHLATMPEVARAAAD